MASAQPQSVTGHPQGTNGGPVAEPTTDGAGRPASLSGPLVWGHDGLKQDCVLHLTGDDLEELDAALAAFKSQCTLPPMAVDRH